MNLNHQAIEKAFTKATLAATQILKFAVEHPPDLVEVDGQIVKTADPAVQAKAVAELAGALSREVARYALGPTYAEHQAQKAEWLAKYEAKQAAIAAQHVACSERPCELCTIAREEAEMYDAIVDKAMTADDRPRLDHDRAEMTPDIPSTPWPSRRRAEQHESAANAPVVVESGVSKRILDEAGFDDNGDNEYVHRSLAHVLKMRADGFLLRSGWDPSTVLKGETIEDFREALSILDE